MTEKKYNLSLGELIDRLSIAMLKHAKIPEHKEEYGREIEDLLHDINLELSGKREYLNAEHFFEIMNIAEFNTHIWYNETDVRNGMALHAQGNELSTEEWASIGKKLSLTHSLNGIRSTAKNRMNKIVGGRMDYKIDCLAADAEQWRPHGY